MFEAKKIRKNRSIQGGLIILATTVDSHESKAKYHIYKLGVHLRKIISLF